MADTVSPADLQILTELERKVLWLASWTIHHANHLRDNVDGLKVGGHQASSASLAAIMTALYFHTLRPADRVAVKPHAAPIYHAIQYLLGRQTREKLEGFPRLQRARNPIRRAPRTATTSISRPARWGLGVAQTLFSSLVQDYVRAHGWGLDRPEGRMIALLGDAELDEGNIFEALLEGWKQGVRNCWWIVDYNRQSLDAVVREGLWERYENLFRNFGWDVVVLKYGSLQQAAFAEPGGEVLRRWIDRCPNQLYSALVFQGGAAWRKRLTDEIGDQGPVSRLIDSRSDDELARLMGNLGGHDLRAIIEAFDAIDHDRPVCFIAYTIKGAGLPFAGHKDNHSGLMTPAQMETFRAAMNIRPGHEWDAFEGLREPPEKLRAFLSRVPFAAGGERRLQRRANRGARRIAGDDPAENVDASRFRRAAQRDRRASTSELAARIVTASPDVTVSTNLGPWVNRRRLFAREAMADTFKGERIPSTFTWEFSPSGQHIELGIAEMNLFILLSALGLSHSDQRRAASADRHALRSVHRPRPRCAQLRLLSGCAFHSGGDAVGHYAFAGRRRASVDRAAADRTGAGRAWPPSSRLSSMSSPPFCAFALDYIQRDGEERAKRAQLAARRNRRLGLFASLHAPDRADLAHDDADAAPGDRRRRLLAARAGAQLPGGCGLYRRGRAGGDPGHRPDGGGPARRRAFGGHLGRPAQCRLDRRLPRARARPRSCPLTY